MRLFKQKPEKLLPVDLGEDSQFELKISKSLSPVTEKWFKFHTQAKMRDFVIIDVRDQIEWKVVEDLYETS